MVNKRMFLSIVLIILSIIIGYFTNVPEIIKSFLSFLIFIILPTHIGEALVYFYFKLFNVPIKNFDFGTLFNYLFYWFCGSLFILIISWIFSLMRIFNLSFIGSLLILIIIIYMVISKKRELLDNSKFLKFYKFGLIFSIVFGVVAALFYLRLSPFPFQLIWDQFSYMFIINKILNLNQFFIIASSYSQIMFLLPKSILLQTLIAFSSFLTNTNPLGFFWVASFFLLTIYSFGLYYFTYYFSKSKLLALISGFMGIFIGATSNAWNPFTLVTSSILALLFPYMLVFSDKYILSLRNIKKTYFYLLIFFIFAFLLNHFLALIIVIFILMYIIIRIFLRLKLFYKISIPISLLIIFFLFIQLKYNQFYFLNNLYLDFFKSTQSLRFKYMFSPANKLLLLKNWYTVSIIYLSFIGVLFCSFKKDIRLRTLILLYSSVLLVYYLPISFSYRIITFIHPLIIFFASYVIYPVKYFKGRIFGLKISNIIILLFMIILISFLLIPLQKYNQKMANQNEFDEIATSFSGFDIKMANWITHNTPTNTLIISEPEQQRILAGLSYREVLGVTSLIDPKILEKTRSSFTSENPELSYNELCSLVKDKYNNSKIIVIISGRVSKWIKNKPHEYIYTPTKFKEFKGFKKFYDKKYFGFLHQENNQIYAFELKNCN